MDLFEGAEVIFSEEGCFDHTPAILRLSSVKGGGKKSFKYFRMWRSHPSFSQLVKGVWSAEIKGTKMFQLVSKLKKLRAVLKDFEQEGIFFHYAKDCYS